jgi:hypothetical protein
VKLVRRAVPALFGFLCVLLAPRIADAKHFHFCFYWHTLTADNSASIDHLKDEPLGLQAAGAFPSDHAASGVRYSFGTVPQQVPVPVGHADQNGCVNLQTSSTSIHVSLYAEQVLQLANGETVTVRTFPNSWMYNVWSSAQTDWTKIPKWIFLLSASDYQGCGASQNTPCAVDLKPTTLYSETSNIQAAATWTLKRLSSLVAPTGFQFPMSQLNILGEDCPSYPGNSCAGDPLNIAETGCESQNPPYACHARYKFVIGHEVGHWFHARYASLLSDGYGDTGPNGLSEFDACWSAAAAGLHTHLLFSREYDGAAYNEGFAHFLSTLAFNDTSGDGHFDYYKDGTGVYAGANLQTLKASHSTPDILDNIDPGGVMCNVCGGQSDRGVEYDWLAFYWAYYATGNSSDQPTFAEILAHTHDASTSPQANAYDKFTTTVQAAHADRWTTLSAQFGVNKCE